MGQARAAVGLAAVRKFLFDVFPQLRRLDVSARPSDRVAWPKRNLSVVS